MCALALTEHFHARGYRDIYEHLVDSYPCERGVFHSDGIGLVPGAEVNIREKAHVIVVGEVAELRRLDGAFSDRLLRGYEPPRRPTR